VALNQPGPEACDALDADCDGALECAFDDWGEDIELANGLIFVATQQAGLRIATLSGSTAVEIGAYDPGFCIDSFTTTPFFVDDVEIDAAAQLAYLASGECGVLVVDVSLPNPLPANWSPPRVASFDTAGWVQDVDVVGDLAYLADHNGGLSILDVSGPNQNTGQPIEQVGGVGFIDGAFGAAIDVEVVGQLAYVATTTGLQIVDVSDPTEPVVIGTFATDPTTGPGQDVEVVQDLQGNTLAYLAAWLDGVYILDVDDPTFPIAIGPGIATKSASLEVTVTGSTALVADGEDGLRLYDVALPDRPLERVGSPYPTPGYAWDMEIQGGRAYIVYGEDPFGRSGGGLLVLTSPYTWLTDFTERSEWIGGFRKDGEPYTTLEALQDVLGPRFRRLGEPVDIPFAIRETRRKNQHSVAEMTVWERC
jgi:hypothetical protein